MLNHCSMMLSHDACLGVYVTSKEYLGDDDWGFALYDPATETYEPAVLPGGQPFGSAVEAYDTAAIVHLTEYAE